MKKQNLLFIILDAIADWLCKIRQDEGALGKLQAFFDLKAGQFYREEEDEVAVVPGQLIEIKLSKEQD